MRELLSIIVPVYNEVTTVRPVVDRLLTIDLPIDREIIVVDDGSTDGTTEVLESLPKRPEILRVIRARVNTGKGNAIRLGFQEARGTVIAIQDADLELDPAQLARLVSPILEGKTRVVYGSRFLDGRPNAPWLSIAANRFLTSMTNVLYGSRLTDMETCYKVIRADIARGLPLQANRFDIEPEITACLLRGGHSILERPVEFQPRAYSSGKKIGWRDGVRAMVVLLTNRFRK
jgi:glycosyltransferase involved in cell wall biosynthesis